MYKVKRLKEKYFGSTSVVLGGYKNEYFVEGYYYKDNLDGTGTLVPGRKFYKTLEEAEAEFDLIRNYENAKKFANGNHI